MNKKELVKINEEIRGMSIDHKLRYDYMKELIKGNDFDKRLMEMIEKEEYDELENKVKKLLEERKIEYEELKQEVNESKINEIVEKTGLKPETVKKMLNFDIEFHHGGYTNKTIKLITMNKDGKEIVKMTLTKLDENDDKKE